MSNATSSTSSEIQPLKKQKSNVQSLFSQLPHAIISIVISFCDASTLFYAVPLICKSVHNHLTRVAMSPKKMEELKMFKFRFPENAETIQRKEKISFKKFLQFFAGSEENKIWRQRCLNVAPSLNIGSDLICYKRVASKALAQKLGLVRPKYLDIFEALSFLGQSLEKAQKRNHELVYTIQHHEKSQSSQEAIEHRWQKLQEAYQQIVQEMKARPAPFSNSKEGNIGCILIWKPIPRTLQIDGEEHELTINELELLEFIRDTTSVTCTSDGYRDTANVTLLSPKNGNWVTITLKTETQPIRIGHEIDDWDIELARSLLAVDLLNERRTKKYRTFKAKEQNNSGLVEVNLKLKPLLNHMGLDSKEVFKRSLWMIIKSALEQSMSHVLASDITRGITAS